MTEACGNGINLCLAIDMSGSVCSPNFNAPQLCTNCAGNCNQSELTSDICCPNFFRLNEFADNVIGAIDASTNGASQFSVSSFSTAANVVTGLTTAAAAEALVDPLGADVFGGSGPFAVDYAGGFTNHQAAIESCETTFAGDTSGNVPVILLITDGVATRPVNTATAQTAGLTAATAFTDSGGYLRPAFVGNPDPTQDTVDYITSLSSDGVITEADDFNNLGSIIDEITEAVGAQGCPPTEAPTPLATTALPTVMPTDGPTKKPTAAPTDAPTKKPTAAPTDAPTKKPTAAPTDAPTKKPTAAPTDSPTDAPTKKPTDAPTDAPTKKPTDAPTTKPTDAPTPCPCPPGSGSGSSSSSDDRRLLRSGQVRLLSSSGSSSGSGSSDADGGCICGGNLFLSGSGSGD